VVDSPEFLEDVTMQKPKRTFIDGIETIAITRPNTARTILMLHGFGASCEDLAPLAPYLDPQNQWNWLFPNGIKEVVLGPHMSGRAWFPIRMADIEAAAMRGEVVDFADVLPDGMAEARDRLTSFLNTMRLNPKDLVIGGFSQGAMMSVEITAHLPADIRGLILFSGTLINRQAWVAKLPLRNNVPFFQSHGRSDPLLGFQHAERLYQELLKAKLKGKFVGFDGGHEIPLPVVKEAKDFIASLV
jgi:phospholipase/carboxylesterase